MKKVFAIVLVLLLVLTMFGCDAEQSVSASKASEEISESATAIVEAEEAAKLAAEQAEEAARIAAEQAKEVARLEAEQAAKEAAEKTAAEEAAKKEQAEQQPVVIPDGGYFITINLSTNKLTLFNGSDVVAVYSVATGKLVNGVSLTPTGRYTIMNKIYNPAWGGAGVSEPIPGGDPRNPLGHYWMGTSAGKSPGTTIGIHGNKDESSIGTYASLGCVRMHNSEVSVLYSTIPIGTIVWIGYTNQLTGWGATNFQ